MNRIETVQAMQDYIREHAMENTFSLEELYLETGYTRRHADRIFKEMLGLTPAEYIKAFRLTKGARQLQRTKDKVLEVALDSCFFSHEGFTRAFENRFHITPAEYKKRQPAIPLFVEYPVSLYQALIQYKEKTRMSEERKICTVTPVERSVRKLWYLPGEKAEDYLSFCEEKGCEWEGLLNSIPEKLDMAALIELPEAMGEQGKSRIAAGVELPEDYAGELPRGYREAILPECVMLYFQSEPFENENDFCEAIESTYAAAAKYQAERYGYRFACELAPSFNYGAEGATGARIAVPAVKK